jgi:hypothetical protein
VGLERVSEALAAREGAGTQDAERTVGDAPVGLLGDGPVVPAARPGRR